MEKNFHLTYNFLKDPLPFGDVSIYQLGRSYCKKDTVIKEHVHTHLYELTVVTGGAGQVYTNSVPTFVKRGDIYLSLPCDAHKIVSDSNDELKYDFIAFAVNDADLNSEFERIAEQYHSPTRRVFTDERVCQTVADAIAEFQDNSIYSNELLTAFFKQIVIYIIRGFKKIKPFKHRDTVTDSEILCYKLMNYIDTHIYSIKNLEELCDITNYSYGYLSTIFKKTTSNTLSGYYREKKLDIARLLVIENRFSITEISDMLGYTSVYAFSKAFTSRFGLSPRTYRNSRM